MSYDPQPNSVAGRVLAMLRSEGPLSCGVLAERVGHDFGTVDFCLRIALDRGVVKRNEGRLTPASIYSLGDGEPVRVKDEDFPRQRTVAATDSPKVDIDAVHRSRPWRELLPEAPEGFLCGLIGAQLRIVLDGRALTLTPEQTHSVRRLLGGAA